MSTPPGERVLVACIGNIFLGDDGFGPAVARELMRRPVSPEIVVIDYGIRGLDLAYALSDPWRAVIFVDAVARGGAPGTIYQLECAEDGPEEPVRLDPHVMDPMHLMAMARTLCEVTARMYVVGCEPVDLGGEGGRMGLSKPVRAAVPPAARTVLDLAASLSIPARSEKPRDFAA